MHERLPPTASRRLSAAFVACALALGGKDFEVAPRTLAWDALSPEVFDLRWRLPEEHRKGRDLLAEMRRLAALRFGPAEVADPAAGGSRTLGTLGDLVLATRDLDRTGLHRLLDSLRGAAPEAMADWGAGLEQLLDDADLRSGEWDPAHEGRHDGMLTAEDWEPGRVGSEPWNALGDGSRFAQGAALLRADLAAIAGAENDYRAYPSDVGADYEEIAPLAGRHYRGSDPAGRPFSVVWFRFRCDLPFPFSDYTCDLRLLKRWDEDGVARTDLLSTSRDFRWLAGRDELLPVRDGEGAVVAYLLVRQFGFDLSGVPDGPDDRRAALRGNLGNLKRRAEARFRAAGRPFDLSPEAWTDFQVLGTR